MGDRITINRDGGTYLWAVHSTEGLLDRAPFAGLVQIDILARRLREHFPNAEIVLPDGMADIGATTRPQVSVLEMKLGGARPDGSTSDFFVSIRVGDRHVTPHVFRERYKAEYHVALYDWLLNGGDEPKLMAFGPDEWPARKPDIDWQSRAIAAEALVDRQRDALTSARGAFKVEYQADGSVMSVGYDSEALRPLVATLDAALEVAA